MAYNQKIWKNRVSTYPTRRLLQETGIANTYDVSRAEGTITVPGDVFDADNMNDLEERIKAGLAEKANGSHSQPASTITAGTLAGAVVAQANANYTTRQVRNVVESTAAPSGGANGDLWFQYE